MHHYAHHQEKQDRVLPPMVFCAGCVGCGCVELRRELCALCEGYCQTVTFTQCTQRRELCALCEGYCQTITFTQCTQLTTQLHTTANHSQHNQCKTPYAVVHGLVSPDDGHNDARNMLR